MLKIWWTPVFFRVSFLTGKFKEFAVEFSRSFLPNWTVNSKTRSYVFSQRRMFLREMVGRLAARNLAEKWIFRGTQEARPRPSVSGAGCVRAPHGDMWENEFISGGGSRATHRVSSSLRNLPTLARRSGDFNERESFDDTCECIKGWDPGVRWLGEWPFPLLPSCLRALPRAHAVR